MFKREKGRRIYSCRKNAVAMYILIGGSVVLGRITWQFKLRVSFCNMKMKTPPQTFNYIWSQVFLGAQGRSGCFVWKIIFFLLASSRVPCDLKRLLPLRGQLSWGIFWHKQRPERLELLFCNILCLFKEDKWVWQILQSLGFNCLIALSWPWEVKNQTNQQNIKTKTNISWKPFPSSASTFVQEKEAVLFLLSTRNHTQDLLIAC